MTTYAQMLELADPPDAYVRGHGWGSVRILMWGSLNANPQAWVRIYGTGQMLVVDQSDLRLADNPGDSDDGMLIPDHWHPRDRMCNDSGCTKCHAIKPSNNATPQS